MTENNSNDEMSPIAYGVPSGIAIQGAQPTNEYKVGHNKPPLLKMVLYVMVIIWCANSWIPF